jgi:hypothetical protein
MGLASASAAERMIRQSFELPPGGTVVVDTDRGGILVEETEGNQVRTEVRVELATEDEAETERRSERSNLKELRRGMR